jgi:Domain of unknown function (DUF4124)
MGRYLQRTGAVATLLALCVSMSVVAEEQAPTTVYRSVGQDGVVSYSDAPQPAAQPIDVYPPARMDPAEQRRAAEAFEQQLEILKILEASRQARAADELARQKLEIDYVRSLASLERARALQEQDYDNDTYYPFFGYPYWYSPQPRPPFGNRPPHNGGPSHGGRPPHGGGHPPRPPPQHLPLPP